MLHTTFKLLRQHHACKDGYREFRKYKSPWGDTQPISLMEILEVRGLDDALWALRATIESAEREVWLLACDYAAHVLHFYKSLRLIDNRTRAAIETAADATWPTAVDASWAANWLALAATTGAIEAGEAARYVAWAALATASEAERLWQKEKLLEILSKFPLTPGKEKI